MRTYASSRVKRKSELQMFSLISGGHICAPKRCTIMVSPYRALQRWVERFGHKGLRLRQIVYILVFYKIFSASSTGRFPIYFFVA